MNKKTLFLVMLSLTLGIALWFQVKAFASDLGIFATCGTQAAGISHACHLLYISCINSGGNPPACEAMARNCNSGATSTFLTCISDWDADPAMPDFCDKERLALQECQNNLVGIYEDCINAGMSEDACYTMQIERIMACNSIQSGMCQ